MGPDLRRLWAQTWAQTGPRSPDTLSSNSIELLSTLNQEALVFSESWIGFKEITKVLILTKAKQIRHQEGWPGKETRNIEI